MKRLTLLFVICFYLITLFSNDLTKKPEMNGTLRVRDVSFNYLDEYTDSKLTAVSANSKHSNDTEIQVMNTYDLDKNSMLAPVVIIDTLVSFVIGSTVPPQDPNGGDIINGGFTIERSGNDPVTGNGIDEITRWNFTYANPNINSSSQVISAQLTLIIEQKDAGASNDFVKGDNCGCTSIFVGLYPLNVIDTVQFEMLNHGYESQLFIDHIIADGFPMFYQDDAIVSFAELKLIISTTLNVLEPNAGELWIAGETDTIKWNGGTSGQFFNIEFSIDSGNTYSLITIGVPADSGYYIWNIPQNILSTKVKIKISDVADSTTFVVSDIFKIKGYVLTRLDANGQYVAFSPAAHGWSYLNGTLWPQSWFSQFQYSSATDPYTNEPYPNFFHSVPDSSFVDWPLWVEVFGEDQCYWFTQITGLGSSYKGDAQVKWERHANIHRGSCFGFAASSFLAFNFPNQFFPRHPGIPNVSNIFVLNLTNTIQKTINGYFAYQYGKQSLDNDVIGQAKDPRTTLLEIMNMFKGDSLDIKTITIYNNSGGGGGAHTMAPISVTVDGSGPSRYRVNLYDSNNPGQNTPYIMVDSLNNTWTDFTGLGATWTGNNHFYLEIPVSNYLITPIMGKQILKPKGVTNIEFYNNEKANVMYTNSSGLKMGVTNKVVTDELQEGIAIFNKNGKPSDPIGYYIPEDIYSVVMDNITDSEGNAYLSVFKEDLAYSYERFDADSLQTDRFYVDEGFSVFSNDVSEKLVNLTVIAEPDSIERIFFIRNSVLRQNDSVYIKELDMSDLVIKNYGVAKTYDLEINERSSQEEEIFAHLSISLPSVTSHTIIPGWDDLDGSPIAILVDNGINGTVDDTLYVENTVNVKDEGNLLSPNEYNLAQNYPNPFNPTTTIQYSIPQRSNVTLKVYDVLGNEIATLVNEEKDRGVYTVSFDAAHLASGMYLYRLTAGSFVETKKMILIK